MSNENQINLFYRRIGGIATDDDNVSPFSINDH